MTPILFIDFDGVLHSAASHFGFETVHLDLLVKLLAPFPAVGLMVHSSWRLTHSDAEIRALLGPAGGRLVGVTDRDFDRERSIQEFVRQHGLVPRQFRVLDDQPELMPQLAGLEVVIACDSESGVSDSAALAGLTAWLECGQ